MDNSHNNFFKKKLTLIKEKFNEFPFITKYIIIMLIVLLVTHVLYKIQAPCTFMEHVWEAGDIVAFAGTAILGYMSYTQNKQANETNTKILEQQKKEFEITNSPKIIVYLRNQKLGNDRNYMVLVVENIGNDIARNIKVTVDGIKYEDASYDEMHNDFKKNLERLNRISFSLKPFAKLKTPISKRENISLFVSHSITVKVTYEYRNWHGNMQTCELPAATLSIDEFELFNLEVNDG